VKIRSANPHGVTIRKVCCGRGFAINEANTWKAPPFHAREFDPQFCERFKGGGHQAFATGFIDWRYRTVGDGYFKSFLTCRNRSGQTGWPATNNKNALSLSHLSSFWSPLGGAAKLTFSLYWVRCQGLQNW
jgi:hypothetical protein